jgi:hypothetical protein
MKDLDKPSNVEEDYFAREEIEKKRQLALKQARETEEKRKQELKALHWMKCPKCGMDLQTLSRGAVEIDTCFNCHGIFLDEGELERLLKGEGKEAVPVMSAVLNLFKRK